MCIHIRSHTHTQTDTYVKLAIGGSAPCKDHALVAEDELVRHTTRHISDPVLVQRCV